MSDSIASLYGGPAGKRVRTRDLLLAKERGEKWAMLTSYDQYTAQIFDEAGIPVLLVGDSAANPCCLSGIQPPTTCSGIRPRCP
jgi:3-methyl-2-oxobutanoate hydroxymethyltransferase